MQGAVRHRGAPARDVPWMHLVIRFLLELALVAGAGYWGWQLGDGGELGLLLALLFVVVFAAVWGVFGTPGDPSRGRAIVAIPGWVRLLLEAALIGIVAYGIWTSWSRAAAETLLTALAVHYAFTWERSRWLLGAPASPEQE